MRALAFTLLTVFAIPFAADVATAQSKGPKLRIAVMEPEWDDGVVQSSWSYGGNSPDVYVRQRQTFARGLNEMMIAELLNSDRFIVVERKALEDVLAEQNLQYSGAVNPETAVEAGRLVGAQYFIRPTITEYSYGEEGGTKGGAVKVPVDVPVAGGIRIGGGKAKIIATLTIDSRIYDIETAQILASVKGEGAAEQKMSGFGLDTDVFDYNSTGFKNTPLGEATRTAVAEVVKNLVDELGSRPWQGRVVTVQGGQIYVNAGSDTGIQVGDILDVSRPGEELVDPETGISLGQVESKLGRLKVTSVQERFAITAPQGSFTCERNDIVRYVVQ